MTSPVDITVVVEDTAQDRDLLPQHGFACWIDTGEHHILFDTGQSPDDVLSHNAQKLGVPLQRTDAVVLSHGHYDHTGGLGYVLRVAPQPRVYGHPSVFQPKFVCGSDGTGRDIGTPITEDEVRRQAGELIWTEEPTEICDGVFVTGEIPRVTDFEDTGGDFFLDASCRTPDPLLDDQALFFAADRGTVVLLGCAHAGVVNTLRYVLELTEGRPIHTVIGGMHLLNASPRRMKQTIRAFDELPIDHLGPAHCTGQAAMAEIRKSFPGQYISWHTGATMKFRRPAAT